MFGGQIITSKNVSDDNALGCCFDHSNEQGNNGRGLCSFVDGGGSCSSRTRSIALELARLTSKMNGRVWSFTARLRQVMTWKKDGYQHRWYGWQFRLVLLLAKTTLAKAMSRVLAVSPSSPATSLCRPTARVILFQKIRWMWNDTKKAAAKLPFSFSYLLTSPVKRKYAEMKRQTSSATTLLAGLRTFLPSHSTVLFSSDGCSHAQLSSRWCWAFDFTYDSELFFFFSSAC